MIFTVNIVRIQMRTLIRNAQIQGISLFLQKLWKNLKKILL